MEVDVSTSSGIDLVGLDFLDEGEFRCVGDIDRISQDISGKFANAVEGPGVFAELHMSRTASGRTIDVALVDESVIFESEQSDLVCTQV